MRLIHVTNTYKIFDDEKEVGWIRFIKYADQHFWRIEAVSEGLPVLVAHFSPEVAKTKLERNGLRWERGENKPHYLPW